MGNMHTHSLTLYLFLLLSLSSGALVQADQNAPELPGLFSQLAATDNPSEATQIEGLIRLHWREAPDEKSAELMSEIVQAMTAAELPVALQLSNDLVESHPDYAEAWNKRATVHFMMRDNASSVADIRETLALEPRHFAAISGLGLIFLRVEKFDEAMEAYQQVLAISPASAGAERSVNRLRQLLGLEI